MQPGKCYRSDYHDERQGTCCLCVAVEPLTGFRFAQVYEHRTKVEYAKGMKALTELPRYANVAGFRLVQENLNTVRVKGKREPVTIYELIGYDGMYAHKQPAL